MDEQIQSEPQVMSKKERRFLRREENKKIIAREKSAKSKKTLFTWLIILIVAGTIIWGIFRYFSAVSPGEVSADLTKTCVNHGGISMHIHPHLTITRNGEAQELPANIGVSAGCMRPLHTHDASGQLHIEFPRQHDFTLGDFFKVWDKPFPAGENLSVTVNGEPNSDFENLILRDDARIVISYDET